MMTQTQEARAAQYPLSHQWMPYYSVWYREGKETWYVHTPRATYADLVRARDGAREDQARAKKRQQVRAYATHAQRLALLERVLDTFGTRMALQPIMTLAEACGDPLPPRVVPVPPLHIGKDR